jgi:4-amino-4-deoxychorismate lyase
LEGPFRRQLPDDLTLIETFGWRYGPGFVNIRDHLARLERTARLLAVPFDRRAIERGLGRHAGGTRPLRVRLTLARSGAVAVEARAMAPGPELWTLRLAEERLDPADPWLRVKTSMRGLYDSTRAALPAGVDEAVFLNSRGEVCEGTITNLFLRVGGTCLTPPRASGLLPGGLRGQMLRQGRAQEAVLRPEDLERGALFVGNSLRGLVPARLG